MNNILILETIYIVWNLVVFFMVGLDKLKAKNHWYRISEFTLLFSSFAMGGVGASIGMIVFHHKISKLKFRILVPIAIVLNILLIGFFIYSFAIKV